MTPEQQAAIRQALEALKMCRGLIRNNIANGVAIESPNPFFSADVDNAITALCQVLQSGTDVEPATELRKQPAVWVGLTDEEIYGEGSKHEKFAKNGNEWFDRGSFARAVEAKLKEKNT
jgi:hypothetical protein